MTDELIGSHGVPDGSCGGSRVRSIMSTRAAAVPVSNSLTATGAGQ